MVPGLVGQKVGMTRVFTDKGDSIAVSVIEVIPNRITQVKNIETDGYKAIQVTTGKKKASRLSKPMIGHYAKANVEPGIGLWEFRVNSLDDFKVGNELTVKLFETISLVDVVGVSKGKGFAGVIKRHNFSTQDASHGNSLSHRVGGSIGQRQSPGKVFKGKKMAGQMGNKQITVPNLDVVKIDAEKGLILISGGVPGAPGSYVVIYPAKGEKE
ncbi:MAG TPA: 50S ribosomal protein L3 [Gammaproteobacteria bacterium]|nr:50S ribosomal protein L3 [Gammaproteobacteria bacterium]